MSAKFTAVNPTDIEFELTIKLTLGQWQKVSEQLKKGDSTGCDSYPASEITDAIRSMTYQATKNFVPEPPTVPPKAT